MNKLFLGILLLVFLCATTFAGEAFVKGGLVIHPTEGLSTSDRWLIDFGSDYRVGYMVGLGWEIATAYYSQDFGGDTLRTAPINAFMNLKISSPTEGVRPFGKIGFGAVVSILNFQNNTSTSTSAGLHLSGGVEAGHFVAELAGIKRFKGNSPFQVVLLGGFVW
jgi:hypothetical protein